MEAKVPTTEHTWRSEDNLQAWVLSLYHVGPRVEFRWAGIVASTFTL